MATMTGARFLAETLHGYGVTHFFFMPVVIPDAMPEMERMGISRIMTHGEKAAAYMADGYARVRRGIGVCGAQSVGALNLAAGLQDAYLACSPVVALTGRLPQVRQDRNAYQEVSHAGPFAAVTKYSMAVTAVDHFPRFLRQAIREAVTATPRPTHLDLWGIFGGEVMTGEADLEIVVEEPFTQIPPFRPEPELAPVLGAIELLVKARRPIVVAGGGVTVSGAGQELVELSDRLQLPVITSLNAKETFPFDHPLAVGVSGQYSRACANRALAEADLVFFVGSHTGGQVTNDWRIPRPGTQVIQLDIDPAELGRSFPISVGMQGDARAGLRKMLAHCSGVESSELSRSRAGWIARIHQLVREWRDEVAPIADSDLLPMRPERLCKELTRLLPDDAILVSDTGHAGIWTGTMVDLTSPAQSYIRCAGSLGWGIPAAIGAKCAAGDRPVICFTGDGGVWYHMTELDTALRYGIHTVTLINNNASLNQEKDLNEGIYGGRQPGSDLLWRLTDADFAKIAESMGCFGIQVNKPSELAGALEQALASDRPAVIDVKTHIEGIAPKAWDRD